MMTKRWAAGYRVLPGQRRHAADAPAQPSSRDRGAEVEGRQPLPASRVQTCSCPAGATSVAARYGAPRLTVRRGGSLFIPIA